MGVVFAAFGEGDGGDAAALVSDLDAFAGAEGAAAVDCAGGVGVPLLTGWFSSGLGLSVLFAVAASCGRKKSFSILAESVNRLWRITPQA